MATLFVCTLCPSRSFDHFCCEALVKLHIALDHDSKYSAYAIHMKEIPLPFGNLGRKPIPTVYLELSKLLASHAHNTVLPIAIDQSRDILELIVNFHCWRSQSLGAIEMLVRSQQFLHDALEVLQDTLTQEQTQFEASLAGAIQADEEMLLDWLKPDLCEIFTEAHLRAACPQPSDAQALLDLVDRFLTPLRSSESTHNKTEEKPETRLNRQDRRSLRRIIIKLADIAGDLPRALRLYNVELQGNDPVKGGSFADIFIGKFRGEFKVAMKRLRCFLQQDREDCDKLLKKFCREALMWKNLRHCNILPFLGIATKAATLQEGFQAAYLVSPWMEKGHVRTYIRTLSSDSKEFEILRLLREIAHGLSYLHSEGLIHGDLRGPNILIDPGNHARLADFGLSRLDGSTSATNGTIEDINSAWRAPELNQWNEDGHMETCALTFSSDVYSYGGVCWELSTDTDPRRRRDVRGELITRPPCVTSDGLWDVIKNCWDIIPEDRRPAYALVVELRKLEMEVRRETGNFTDRSPTAESPVYDGGAPAGITGASLSWTEDGGDRSVSTLRRQFGSSPDSARRQTPQTNDSGYFDTPTLKRPRRGDDLAPDADDESPTRKRIRSEDASASGHSPTQARPERRSSPLTSPAKRSPGRKIWDRTKKFLGKAMHTKRPSPSKPLASISTISVAESRTRGDVVQGSSSNGEESGEVGTRSPFTTKRKRRDGDSAEASPSRVTKKSRSWTVLRRS